LDNNLKHIICRIESKVDQIDEKLDRHMENTSNRVTHGQLVGYLTVLTAVFATVLTAL
jgi:hypothetical protein